jgi:hypothetical protein
MRLLRENVETCRFAVLIMVGCLHRDKLQYPGQGASFFRCELYHMSMYNNIGAYPAGRRERGREWLEGGREPEDGNG